MNAAQKKKRAANKAARAKRRDEIQTRWNHRRAWRLYREALRRNLSVDDLLFTVTHYSLWVGRAELLQAIPEARRLVLLAYCIRVIQLKEMPYDEYLQTPEWADKTQQAKMRFHGACALSDQHDAVDTHHRTYERRGHERVEDLIPLCRDCHSLFHKHLKLAQ